MPRYNTEGYFYQLSENYISGQIDAVERFLDKLAGVDDPQRKRMIISGEFIRVFEEEARNLTGIELLGQGTIYPDIIECGSSQT